MEPTKEGMEPKEFIKLGYLIGGGISLAVAALIAVVNKMMFNTYALPFVAAYIALNTIVIGSLIVALGFWIDKNLIIDRKPEPVKAEPSIWGIPEVVKVEEVFTLDLDKVESLERVVTSEDIRAAMRDGSSLNV